MESSNRPGRPGQEAAVSDARQRFAVYAADLVCCLLLGTAACYVWLSLLRLGQTVGGCALFMAADLALIALFSRRWWVLPVTLAVLAVGFAAVSLLQADGALWRYMVGFFQWIAQGFPQALPYSRDGSIALVRLFAALPVAALIYAYFRRLFVFAALPPAALALMLWGPGAGAPMVAMLLMLLGAMLISLARAHGVRVSKRLPEADRMPALLRLFAMAFVPAILLLALLFTPAKDGALRSKSLVNLVEDIGTALDTSPGASYAGSTFSLGGAGFYPLGNRLGGDIKPDNTVVLRVTTLTPLRLNGAVCDTYDGKMWYDSHILKRYRLISPFFQEQRREAFGLEKPLGGAQARELYKAMSTQVSLNVECVVPGNTLFCAGQTQSVERLSFDGADVYFNPQAEVTTAAELSALSYTLNTVVPNREAEGFEDNMRTLEQLAGSSKDNAYERIKEEYLQLPTRLPSSIEETAAGITEGKSSAYDKAAAIEAWLQANCTYTFTPGTPPENEDFAAYFLKTRRGYCVYYASAMTVLCRSIGLPARYVTGYALKGGDPDAPNAYLATNATAHAWTEVYFQGVGWIAFDATGWDFSTPASAEYRRPGASQRPYTDRLPADARPAEIETLPELEGASGNGGGIVLAVIFALAVALCLFAAAHLWLLHADAGALYARLRRLHKTPDGVLNACYARVIKQAGFWGVKPRPEDTIATFTRRAEKVTGEAVFAACEPVARLRFALLPPSEEELRALCGCSAALEQRLRMMLGFWGYLCRRALIGR